MNEESSFANTIKINRVNALMHEWRGQQHTDFPTPVCPMMTRTLLSSSWKLRRQDHDGPEQ